MAIVRTWRKWLEAQKPLPPPPPPPPNPAPGQASKVGPWFSSSLFSQGTHLPKIYNYASFVRQRQRQRHDVILWFLIVASVCSRFRILLRFLSVFSSNSSISIRRSVKCSTLYFGSLQTFTMAWDCIFLPWQELAKILPWCQCSDLKTSHLYDLKWFDL